MDKRVLYSTILKIMALLFGLVIFAVLVNSFFPVQTFKNEEKTAEIDENILVRIDVNKLPTGKMLLTQWKGLSVGIIHRMKEPEDFTAPPLGEHLNKQWRSVSAPYFVFFNSAGVAKCPLYFHRSGDMLEDTCSRILYTTAGVSEANVPALRVPPHYFDKNKQLVIGQWVASD